MEQYVYVLYTWDEVIALCSTEDKANLLLEQWKKLSPDIGNFKIIPMLIDDEDAASRWFT